MAAHTRSANHRWRLLAALALVALPAAAEAHPVALWLLFKGVGLVAGTTKLTDFQAGRAYEHAHRIGTCSQRRERFLNVLPNALRFARYSRDIYDHGEDLKSEGLTSKDLGQGRTAYYDPDGQRYAEVRVDIERHEAVVVFRGTRLSVGSDVSTNVLSLVGIETAYYRWASALVARTKHEHPGLKVIATGHSLGGGLVLYSVLHNPGVEGVAFNPSGLSWVTWIAASRADRARANTALTIISTRHEHHIEPITAMSFAGRTVLPGQVFTVETETWRPLPMHRASTLVAGLEHLEAESAGGSACDDVLGQLTH